MMRIIHIVGTLNPGGIERIVVDLAIAQKQIGHQPCVCCVLRREGLFLNILQRYEIPVFDACSKGLPWRIGKALAHVLEQFKPDVVHSHVNFSLFWQVIGVKRVRSVPFIVTQHSLMSVSSLGRLRARLLYRLAQKHIALHTAVSRYAACYAAWLYGIPLNAIRVIYNGVHVSHYKFNPERRAELRHKWGIPPDGFLWGSVGRFDPIKGHDLLLDAFAQAVQRVPSLWLALVGKGDLEAILKAKSIDLGCNDRILWLGQREDISDVLSAFDGYVQPSRQESLSLAILEALANGLPVVATKVGGIPEIASYAGSVVNLVPPEDPEALATALQAIEQWQKLNVPRNSLLPEVFSFQTMLESYQRCYQEVCNQ